MATIDAIVAHSVRTQIPQITSSSRESEGYEFKMLVSGIKDRPAYDGPSMQRVRVARIDDIAVGVKRFELVGVAGEVLSGFSAGAHIVITMRDKDQIWRNPYSIMSATADNSGYVISVRCSPESQGGSQYMHKHVRVGSELDISEPINRFPIVRSARKHVLIAGGIGITPMLAMRDELKRDAACFELHYAVRSPNGCANLSELTNDANAPVHVYHSDRGQRIPLASILSSQPLDTHVYVCGPQRMIDWVIEVADRAGWPEENVHCERFRSTPPDKTNSHGISHHVATRRNGRGDAVAALDQ